MRPHRTTRTPPLAHHAAHATPFSGNSASSQPVNWFWGVDRGGATPAVIALTLNRYIVNGLLTGSVK